MAGQAGALENQCDVQHVQPVPVRMQPWEMMRNDKYAYGNPEPKHVPKVHVCRP